MGLDCTSAFFLIQARKLLIVTPDVCILCPINKFALEKLVSSCIHGYQMLTYDAIFCFTLEYHISK